MIEKYKYLLNNIGIFTLSSFATKILSFLIVPFYTYYLNSEQYATIDLFNMMLSLLIPVLTLCINEAMLRFIIEDEKDRAGLYNITFIINVISWLLVALFYPVYKHFAFMSGYEIHFIIIFGLTVFNERYSGYARAIDKTKVVMVASILNTLCLLTLNVILISMFGMKEDGYFISMICALLVSNIYYSYILKPPCFKWECLKEITVKNNLISMLKYAIPLVPNSVFWWINSAMDRVAITSLVSLSAVGLYAVSSKIPSILSVFLNIFQQAWNLSAFKEFKENDFSFFEGVLTIFSSCMVLMTSGLLMISKILASLMFQKEFFVAWRYVPYLLIAFYFNAINTYLGAIYTSSKKTKGLFYTTICGAIVNIILNFSLIPVLGTTGAAVATCISNLVVFAVRISFTMKQFKIKLNLSVIIGSSIMMGIQTYFLLNDIMIMNVACFIAIAVVSLINILKLRFINESNH